MNWTSPSEWPKYHLGMWRPSLSWLEAMAIRLGQRSFTASSSVCKLKMLPRLSSGYYLPQIMLMFMIFSCALLLKPHNPIDYCGQIYPPDGVRVVVSAPVVSTLLKVVLMQEVKYTRWCILCAMRVIDLCSQFQWLWALRAAAQTYKIK